MGFDETPGKGRKVGIIGVPLGFGAGQIGSELGVDAMRLSKIRGQVLIEHIRQLGYEVTDYGDVDIEKPQRTPAENENPRFLTEILQSSRNMAISLKTILAAIIPSQSELSPAFLRIFINRIKKSALSGSMPMPTSIRRKHRNLATFTECRWLSSWEREITIWLTSTALHRS